MITTYRNPTIYDVNEISSPTPKLLLYNQITDSTSNLMMAHLQGRNM